MPTRATRSSASRESGPADPRRAKTPKGGRFEAAGAANSHQSSSNGHRGLAGAVKAVAERASTLVRLELELAALELKQKVVAIGVGIGLALGAAVFAVFAFGFLFATIAAALATFLATWLALLVVTLFLFVVVAVLGLLGIRSIKKGTPPVPQQAIREAKLTTTAIRSD